MDVKVNLEEAKKLLSVPESCLRKVEGELTVLVHPMHSSNIKEGVLEELKALIKRYSKELKGIPMAYEKIQLVSSNGWLFDTNPFHHVVVRAMFYVFTPQIGNILEATVKKKSINHVGCLVHGMFNVSVPRPQEEAVENWCGTCVQEGDVVKLTITDLNVTTYIPYIKGELDPDRVQELVDARREEEEQKAEANKKVTFDDDSGISSNDHEENVVPEVKKKKKKNVSCSDSDDQNNTVMDDSEDATEVDGTQESQKKKRKRNQEDGEASNVFLLKDVEKKKKKKKKQKQYQESDDEVDPEEKTEENDILDSLLNESSISNSDATPKRKKKKGDKLDEEETPIKSSLSDSESKETKKKKKKHKKRIESSDVHVEENDLLDSLLNESINSNSNDTPRRKKKKQDNLDEEEATDTLSLSDSETKETKKRKKKHKKRMELSDIDVEEKDTEENDFRDVSSNLLNERMASDYNTTPKRKNKQALESEDVDKFVLNSDSKSEDEKKKHKKNKHRAVEPREENEVNLDEMLDDLMKEMSPSKPSGKTPDAVKPTKSKKRKADEDLNSSRSSKRKKV
ncbi:DNA-directed RNA polymerase I subunit RPA43 [Penaeus vannamei]|uniref:DNA-directed RNA polymerase I subunit RPA43 n=1 Tax=Penaeus vannamei TaxID=6689 RepID=UPI00387F601F